MLKKDKLYWCDKCNIPLRNVFCYKCKTNGRFILYINDLHFASSEMVNIINALFYNHFGISELFKDKIVLLNKQPGLDRVNDIILDGHVLGTINFEVDKKNYSLQLQPEGIYYVVHRASCIGHRAEKKIAIIDEKKTGGKHLKGSLIKKKMFKYYPGDVYTNDELPVTMGNFYGSGKTRLSSDEFQKSSDDAPVIRLRNFKICKFPWNNKKVRMYDIITGNSYYLDQKIQQSKRELKKYLDKNSRPVTVAISGGKDSLVVLDILHSLTTDFTGIFIDTELEFPETYEYIKRIKEFYKIEIKVAKSEVQFWNLVEQFGPPAKDYRWCCKVLKLSPVTELIKKEYPHGCVTLEGRRKNESFSRSNLNFVENNPFVPGQITLQPIRDWNAFDVWQYIYSKKLPYNPLYDMVFERIGCYLCPAVLDCEFEKVRELHAPLYTKWVTFLEEYYKKQNLPDEYYKFGFWRWKELPPKMVELAKNRNINLTYGSALSTQHLAPSDVSFDYVKGFSPCETGGYSVEGKLRLPVKFPINAVANVLYTLGSVKLSEELGVVLLNSKRGTAKIFSGFHIYVVSDSINKLENLFHDIVSNILRVQLCTLCKICEKKCPRNAVHVKDTIKIDTKLCTHCTLCLDGCLFNKYIDKMVKVNSRTFFQ